MLTPRRHPRDLSVDVSGVALAKSEGGDPSSKTHIPRRHPRAGGDPSSNMQAWVTIFAVLFCLSSLKANWQEQFKQKIADGHVPAWAQQQLASDLHAFTDGITRDMLDQTFNYSREIARFKIIDNQVYTELNTLTQWGKGCCPGSWKPVERQQFIQKALEDLASCVRLPSVEFLLLLSDGTIDTLSCPGPLCAFSKNKQKNKSVILFPDPYTLSGCQDLKSRAINGSAAVTWDQKIKKAFWRGAPNDPFFTRPTLFKQSPFFALDKTV